MPKCSAPKPINVANPDPVRRRFLTDDDDEGDKRKSTLRPDNDASTKAAQKSKWEVAVALSFRRSRRPSLSLSRLSRVFQLFLIFQSAMAAAAATVPANMAEMIF